MIAQYSAAALASQNKVLAHPSSADTIPTSANTEDHVSMATNAAHHAVQVVQNVESIVGIEWLVAAQGVDLRRRLLGEEAKLGKGTAVAFELLRSEVPFLERDQPLTPLIDAATRLIRAGQLVRAVDAAI